MSSSARPICRTLAQTGFMVSSNGLSTIFFKTIVSSIAIAEILSPFFKLAAFRTFAGMIICPLEETLVVAAFHLPSPLWSKNILSYKLSSELEDKIFKQYLLNKIKDKSSYLLRRTSNER